MTLCLCITLGTPLGVAIGLRRAGWRGAALSAGVGSGAAARGPLAICLVGAPGCGKTTLLEATVRELRPAFRAGVIACDRSPWDPDRLWRNGGAAAYGGSERAEATRREALSRAVGKLGVEGLDVVFVESSVMPHEALPAELARCMTAAVFSVAAGDGAPSGAADVVRAADVVLLCKADLARDTGFDRAAFRRAVRDLNANMEIIEIAPLLHGGVGSRMAWLKVLLPVTKCGESHWFG